MGTEHTVQGEHRRRCRVGGHHGEGVHEAVWGAAAALTPTQAGATAGNYYLAWLGALCPAKTARAAAKVSGQGRGLVQVAMGQARNSGQAACPRATAAVVGDLNLKRTSNN